MNNMLSQGAMHLDAFDIAIAALLVLVAGVVSLVLKLGLERRLLLASIRTVVQLFLIGYVLRYVFRFENLPLVLAVVTLMVLAAARASVRRSSRKYSGVYFNSFIILVLSGMLTSYSVTGVIIGVDPWYKTQYMIPLLGMILGNSLTGISLTLDYLLESLSERRNEVETELAMGATKWEAARAPLADAVRRGMIPVINSMMVVGIVSLPGMMTGQILQGADPVQAVRYQIVVMFMIAAATSGGCMGIALLTYKKLFNARHQLDYRLIEKR